MKKDRPGREPASQPIRIGWDGLAVARLARSRQNLFGELLELSIDRCLSRWREVSRQTKEKFLESGPFLRTRPAALIPIEPWTTKRLRSESHSSGWVCPILSPIELASRSETSVSPTNSLVEAESSVCQYRPLEPNLKSLHFWLHPQETRGFPRVFSFQFQSMVLAQSTQVAHNRQFLAHGLANGNCCPLPCPVEGTIAGRYQDLRGQ